MAVDPWVHALLRGLVVLAMITVIVIAIYYNNEDEITLQKCEHVIKPGTILHRSIKEMDEVAQKNYLNLIRDVVSSKKRSTFKKYLRGIQIPIVAGLIAEYIVFGKHVHFSGLAKTFFYANMYTILSLLN